MSKPSSIDRLPEPVRESLHAWLRDPGITQTQATARLNLLLTELGVEQRVSRHAVNRYDLRMRAVGEKLRHSRQVAEAWMGKLGAEPQGKLGHLINEILRTLALDITLKLQEGELDPESLAEMISHLKQLSLATIRLERAASENVKREVHIKRQAGLELAEKAEAESNSGRALTPERIREIVREAYGA